MQRTTSHREPATVALVERETGMPWWWPVLTREARECAAAAEAHESFTRYFRKAMKVRNWTPWDDLPLAEMHERGQRLSEDTLTIIQAYSAWRTTSATTSRTV